MRLVQALAVLVAGRWAADDVRSGRGAGLSLLHDRHAEHAQGLHVQHAAAMPDDRIRSHRLLSGEPGLYRQREAARTGGKAALSGAEKMGSKA